VSEGSGDGDGKEGSMAGGFEATVVIEDVFAFLADGENGSEDQPAQGADQRVAAG
jgi:hypothetical protein